MSINDVSGFKLFGKKYKPDDENISGANQIASIHEEIAKCQEGKATAREQLSTKKAENNTQEQEQVKQISENLASVQSEYSAAAKAASSASKSASAAVSTASKLQSVANSTPKTIKKQTGENETGEPIYEDVANPAYEAAQSAAQAAKQQAEALKQQASELQQQAEALQETCNEIKEAISNIQGDSSSEETEEEDSELQALEDQIEQYEKSIESLNKELDQVQQQNEKLQNTAEGDSIEAAAQEEGEPEISVDADGNSVYKTKLANGNEVEVVTKPDGATTQKVTLEDGSIITLETNNGDVNINGTNFVAILNQDSQLFQTSVKNPDEKSEYITRYDDNGNLVTEELDNEGKTISSITMSKDGDEASFEYYLVNPDTGVKSIKNIDDGKMLYVDSETDEELSVGELAERTQNVTPAEEPEEAEETEEEPEELSTDEPEDTEQTAAETDTKEEVNEEESGFNDDEITDYDRTNAGREAIVEDSNGNIRLDLDKYYDEYHSEYGSYQDEGYYNAVGTGIITDIVTKYNIDVESDEAEAKLTAVYKEIASGIDMDIDENASFDELEERVIGKLVEISWNGTIDDDYIYINSSAKNSGTEQSQNAEESVGTEEAIDKETAPEDAKEAMSNHKANPDNYYGVRENDDGTLTIAGVDIPGNPENNKIINDDGKPELGMHILKDSDGNPIATVTIDSSSYKVVQTDKNGNITETIYNKETNTLTERKLDSSGKLVKEANKKVFDENNRILSSENTKYDSGGNVISFTETKKVFDEHGRTLSSENTKYDSDGNIVNYDNRKYTYNEDGTYTFEVDNPKEHYSAKQVLENGVPKLIYYDDAGNEYSSAKEAINSNNVQSAGGVDSLNNVPSEDTESFDSSKTVNGEIDENTVQGNTGDCWLISALYSMASSEKGKEIIKNSITVNDDSSVTVTFGGIGVDYAISNEELMAHDTDNNEDDKYSNGDNDVLVMELAVEKLFKDINNNIIEIDDKLSRYLPYEEDYGMDTGGDPSMLYYCLAGAESHFYYNDEDDSNLSEDEIFEALNEYDENSSAYCFGIYGGEHTIIEFPDGAEHKVSLEEDESHSLAITNVDKVNKTVTFIDPNDTKKYKITVSWDDFVNLGIGEMTCVNLDPIANKKYTEDETAEDTTEVTDTDSESEGNPIKYDSAGQIYEFTYQGKTYTVQDGKIYYNEEEIDKNSDLYGILELNK